MLNSSIMSSSSSSSSSFSFKAANTSFLQIPLNESLDMCMKTVGPAIARVYFVDSGAEVRVPLNFTIYDDTNQVPVVPVRFGSFVLHWADNYTIKYNNVVICSLVTHRQWDITLPTK